MRVRIAEQKGDGLRLSHPSGRLAIRGASAPAPTLLRTPVELRRSKGTWTAIESAGAAGA